MAEAPYLSDIAGGPGDLRACWLTCADGVRIRVADWGAGGARGTVLLFPGRTEYIEKYAPAAAEFRARGLATVAVDWRGQGLADRLAPDPALGHIPDFLDYQNDVGVMVDHARAMGLPRPWYLVAHSMGGAIGLRALLSGLAVEAAVFTGPMWGILMPAAKRPLAWALSALSRPLRQDLRLAPEQTLENYVALSPFAGNMLTSDPDEYAVMKAQLAAHPELALGGPTLAWLHEALKEMRALARLPAPAVPALTYLGAEEAIVDPAPIHRRMAAWPGGRLVVLPGARHEVMMERPAIRSQVFDGMPALLAPRVEA